MSDLIEEMKSKTVDQLLDVFFEEEPGSIIKMLANQFIVERFAALEARNAELEAENEDWNTQYGKHLDEYNSFIGELIEKDFDRYGIPKSQDEVSGGITYHGTLTAQGRLNWLLEEYKRLRDK